MDHLLSDQELFFSVRECLSEQLPADMSMQTSRQIRGRSGGMRDAVEVRREGENFGRLFYAEDMYTEYLQGSTPAQIARCVADMCVGGLPCEPMSVLDYEQAKEHLMLRLINYENNREGLGEYVYRRFLDLAVTCRVIVLTEEPVLRTAAVSRLLLERWGVSEDEVFEQAEKCMMRDDAPVIRPLRDILTELDPDDSDVPERESDLYVLTTVSGISGASAVLFSGCVEKLAEELGKDILVLPSSVHEMLLLPDWGEWEVSALRRIVADVNQSVVPSEDYLSNSVYRYRLDERRFVIDG